MAFIIALVQIDLEFVTELIIFCINFIVVMKINFVCWFFYFVSVLLFVFVVINVNQIVHQVAVLF